MRKSLLILLAAVIYGCANTPTGVFMTEDERASCAAEGCTVWTLRELQALAQHVVTKACRRGDAI